MRKGGSWAGFLVFALIMTIGCQRAIQDLTPRPVPTQSYACAELTTFANCGRLQGHVTWQGTRPQCEAIRGLIDTDDGLRWDGLANPFAPRIDHDGGLANVVVKIVSVADVSVKPWPHPPIEKVIQLEDRMELLQGGPQLIGFVRAGEHVTFESARPHQQIRARGAEHFTLSFRQPSQAQLRPFAHIGLVELTNSTGQFASRVDLLCCEHPYYTRTDEQGRFDLGLVPAGTYEVQAWLRNWRVERRDRDPETGKIVRLEFAEPLTRTKSVNISAEQISTLQFQFRQPK